MLAMNETSCGQNGKLKNAVLIGLCSKGWGRLLDGTDQDSGGAEIIRAAGFRFRKYVYVDSE
jgi:hypothetical protein